MLSFSSRRLRRVRWPARAGVGTLLVFVIIGSASGGEQAAPGPPSGAARQSGGQAALQKSTEVAPAQRIPRQQALTTAAVDGDLREAISPSESRPVAAAQLTLRNLQTGQSVRAASSAEGVFRILPLLPGHYEFRVEAEGYAPFLLPDIVLNANEVTTLEISWSAPAALHFARVSRVSRDGSPARS